MDALTGKLDLARATDAATRLDATGARAAARAGDAEQAAREMERLFATMLVKELRSALPNGLFGDGPGNDTYSAWFDEHLGASLADSGTLDLVGRIKASLAGAPGEASDGPPASARTNAPVRPALHPTTRPDTTPHAGPAPRPTGDEA